MKCVILPCGCHKVSAAGFIYSRLRQRPPRKGERGIQTFLNESWKKIQGTIGHSGYLQVSIHGRLLRVNRLIATNFLPNPNAYPESQHKDGNRLNNRISNLKWGNQIHNAADRFAHGRTAVGMRKSTAKLSDEAVRQIRAGNESLSSYAKKFGVSKKLILLVKQNKIWKHVR